VSETSQQAFIRGTMSMLILSLLKRGDMYGYEIVQKIAQASEGRITTQEGSLYPVLYKLEDQGLISHNKILVGKRMTRVYYHLEKEGEGQLDKMVQDYNIVTDGVRMIIKGCGADDTV